MLYKSSHMGHLHKKTKGVNQDCICAALNNDRTVISLSDGVSSCSEGKAGAEIACEAITHLMMKKGDLIMEYEYEQIAAITVGHILGELEKRTLSSDKAIEDYSSTVSSVLYDEIGKKILCFNLGDSLIMSVNEDGYHIVVRPFDSSDGCCVTTTINAKTAAEVKILDPSEADALIICSDGAWRHLFSGNKMKPEAAMLIEAFDFVGLENYLNQQDCEDDYSFVALVINKARRLS